MHLSRLYRVCLSSSIVKLVELFGIRFAQLLSTIFLSQSYEIYLEAWRSKSIVVDIIIRLSLYIFSR